MVSEWLFPLYTHIPLPLSNIGINKLDVPSFILGVEGFGTLSRDYVTLDAAYLLSFPIYL